MKLAVFLLAASVAFVNAKYTWTGSEWKWFEENEISSTTATSLDYWPPLYYPDSDEDLGGWDFGSGDGEDSMEVVKGKMSTETTSNKRTENEATTDNGTTTTFDIGSTDSPKETRDYDEPASNITSAHQDNSTVNILVTPETYEVENDFEFFSEDEEIDIEVEPPVCNSRVYLLVIVILSISLFIISCGVSVTKLTPYFERNLFGARKARKTDKKIQTRI
eukprot:TRINITY_DN978_c0_g1_i17.p1 TRINITY_DN978_c0_g1~~TRINITY_DN978_c0_g1_i17.p1  ORF type:complete len:220 (-),score=36.67 TRINITY_DN978_c0_g1_i17:222-881(-)